MKCIIFLLGLLCFSCTVHMPFTGDPLICFEEKCRRRIQIKRKSNKSHNAKSFGIEKKRSAYIPKTATIKIVENKKTDSIPIVYHDSIIQTINILFDFDSYALTNHDKLKLDSFILESKNVSFRHLYIYGHTDNKGGYEYNLRLSKLRAELVWDYLKSKFLPEEKASYNGFAYTRPLVDNSTEEGRQQNRRVEFIFVR